MGLRAKQRHSAEDLIAAFKLFDEDNTGYVPAGILRHALHDLTAFPEEEV